MGLYFAYGSNLDIKRMMSRCPSAQVVGVGTLLDYQLVFQNNNRGTIVANLESSALAKAIGVVYHVSELDLETLDRVEGHPEVYKRTNVLITLNNSIELACVTYIMDKMYSELVIEVDDIKSVVKERYYGSPKQEYLDHIVIGFMNFGLSYEYIFRAFDAK